MAIRIALLFFLSLTFSSVSFAQDADTSLAEPINDGPYVYWLNDSTLMAMYICDGQFETYQLNIVDGYSFNGFCKDSSITYNLHSLKPFVEPETYQNVTKIFAVSDIHGEYDHFVSILRVAGIIDDKLNWIWGDGHLVINGDIFDRGDKVTECLWLVYDLERQALESGGQVHYILGNHEMMVLRGDNRYIHDKYLKGIAKKSRIKHEDLFSSDMELGRWLRKKNTALKINDILFVHGGISTDLIRAGYDLDKLNKFTRSIIDSKSYEKLFNPEIKMILRSMGPFWYRGYSYAMDYPIATSEQVDSVLTFYDVESIVVGHTEIDSLGMLQDGKVFAIDIPVDELGSLQGLLWEDGHYYRVSGSGVKTELR